jgi:hypothetical protein
MNMHDSHDRHDRFLVAALAADDLEGQARTDAHELVAACSDCAELLADLRAIAAATSALPPLPRSIDFRLSPEAADRLGARGWRGFLVRLADTRFGVSRPLAVGLTTLGLVGAIAGSIPGAMGGFSSGAAQVRPNAGNALNASESQSNFRDGAGAPASALAAPAASVPPGPPSSPLRVISGSPAPTALVPVAVSAPPADLATPAPSAESAGGVAAAPSAAPSARDSTGDQDASPGVTSLASGSPGPSPLLVTSLVLLLIGLAILGTQWAAARLTNRSPE